jgi:hypothetical protein
MLLNNVECIRTHYTCSGNKACEYIHSEIKQMKIRVVNYDMWTQLQQYGVKDWDVDNRKREALR